MEAEGVKKNTEKCWPVKPPQFLLEFLKLEMMDDLWGRYHCIFTLGPQKSWEMRRAQREKFEQAIREEMKRVGLSATHPKVKAARRAFLKGLNWKGPR